MARIPVAPARVERRVDEGEHNNRLPAWVWPLIPLLLGALALGLSLRGNDDATATPDTPGAVQQGETTNDAQGATGAPVTDMLSVVNDTNQARFVGQPASFANVTVQSVVGDRGFWVGPSTNQQLFVVIDEGAVGQGETAVQIAPGQVLTLNGVVQQLPPLEQAPPEWGLDASNSAVLANQQVYLQANEVLAAE